jgi:DNA processing protein
VTTRSRSPEPLSAPINLIARDDPGYPDQLRNTPEPPEQLWWVGDWTILQQPLVAIVGTRRATHYGLRVTREIAGALARGGACIVSGMALGIDAAAHQAALDAGGATIAVLGNGVDVAYPRAHARLHREIVERGLVISEMAPGGRSHGGSFIKRNRIIAGLARLTLVVEAPFGSGALSTAKVAIDIGRDLGAVPGQIDSPQSRGVNELLRDGAQVITCVDDALCLAGLAPQGRADPRVDDEVEMRVWSALGDGAMTLDELCARSGLPVAQCLSAVTTLELRGAIDCALSGGIRRR